VKDPSVGSVRLSFANNDYVLSNCNAVRMVRMFYFGYDEVTKGFHPPSAQFRFENLPEHKLGSYQLNCRAVLK